MIRKLIEHFSTSHQKFTKHKGIIYNLLPASLFGFKIALFLFEWKLTSPQVLPPLNGDSLTSAQTLALEIFRQRSALISTWTIAVIGSSAFLAKPYLENKIFKKIILTILFLTFSSSLASLFFSQIVLDIMLRTLIIKQDVFENNNLYTAIKCQYISFLIGATGFCMISTIHFFYDTDAPKQ